MEVLGWWMKGGGVVCRYGWSWKPMRAVRSRWTEEDSVGVGPVPGREKD